MKKLLFIDRDGTLVIEPPIDYQLDSLEKLEFYPKVMRNLGFIRSKLDFDFVMVTNQDGLGTTSFPEETFWPAHNLMMKTLEGEGITFDDIESWGGKVEKTGGDAIKSGLQDDLYDMTIDHIGKGQSNTTELCLTHDMYDVELNEDTRNKLCEMGYTPVTVEAGTWNKQDTDIETVGSQQCLIVDANMDAAVAYTLTKAICENKEALVTAVASLEYFDPTIAGGSGYTGCPLHPGAKAYYEEMGYDCD